MITIHILTNWQTKDPSEICCFEDPFISLKGSSDKNRHRVALQGADPCHGRAEPLLIVGAFFSPATCSLKITLNLKDKWP